jgi:hypothetical protein
MIEALLAKNSSSLCGAAALNVPTWLPKRERRMVPKLH